MIERLYALSGQVNAAGQYIFYGRAGGCLVTGNEDGIKHCAMNILYSLQHLGYTIPPQADAGWIGEAGPGPSYGDDGAGFDNDFTNRNTAFMTYKLMHTALMLRDRGGFRSTAISAVRGRKGSASGTRRSTGIPRSNRSHCVVAGVDEETLAAADRFSGARAGR